MLVTKSWRPLTQKVASFVIKDREKVLRELEKH